MAPLSSLLAACLLFAPLSVLAHPSALDTRQAQSLDALFKANGKEYVGACTDPGILSGAHEEVLAREFGSVT